MLYSLKYSIYLLMKSFLSSHNLTYIFMFRSRNHQVLKRKGNNIHFKSILAHITFNKHLWYGYQLSITNTHNYIINKSLLKVNHHEWLPMPSKDCRTQKESYPIAYQQSLMSGEQCQGLCHQSIHGTFYSNGTNVGSPKS